MSSHRFPAPAPSRSGGSFPEPGQSGEAEKKSQKKQEEPASRERGARGRPNRRAGRSFSPRQENRSGGGQQPEKSKSRETPDTCLPDPEAFLQPGLKPVMEILRATPEKIDAIFLRKGKKSGETEEILDLCRKNGVRFTLVEEASLDRLWPGRHQGVIARLFATGFVELEDLLSRARSEPLPLIVALDQVQDPGNAGALARTLYALGGAGMIIPRHNGVFLGAAAAKVAAGALDKLPVAKAANLAQALDAAIDAGFAVYGADAGKAAPEGADTQNVFGFTPDLPAVLVLGSEETGLRPVVRKRCTALVSIPFAREFDSLNVAQAGAIIVSAFAAARHTPR